MIQRYIRGRSDIDPLPDAQGGWVRYADHLAELAKVEAENAKLMRTRVPSEEFEQVRFERDESRRT